MTENRKFNFIVKSVEALPPAPAGKRDTYYDHGGPNSVARLALRVTDKGVKTFYVIRSHNGRPVKVAIGQYPDLSIENARKIAQDINSKLAHGLNPNAEKKAQREAIQGEYTVRQLFDAYIERHAKKTRKTWAVMQQDFERNIAQRGRLADRRACDVSRKDVETLHGRLANEFGEYTANRTLQLLRSIYNKAILWKIFQHDNPASGITLFAEKPRERFLSNDEVQRLLKALNNCPYQWTRDFVLLALLTGVRKSNLYSMRWRDIDFDRGIWTIPETKNGTSQAVPLNGWELQILNDRKDRLAANGGRLGEFVFPSDSASGHITDIKKSWSSVRAEAKIPDCTIHDLRRSFATFMADANVNMSQIKKVMNHKDMKTTLAVYARTSDQAERDARAIAQAKILEALQAVGLADDADNKVIPLRVVNS